MQKHMVRLNFFRQHDFATTAVQAEASDAPPHLSPAAIVPFDPLHTDSEATPAG